MATYNGTFLPDIYVGTDQDDTINGFGSADILSGAGGNDTINGGDGLDILSGGDGDDIIHGDAGDDILHGDAGNDILDGGAAGTISLATILDGGSGDDLLIASSGSLLENYNGGDGIDTLSLVNRTAGVTLALDPALLDIPLVTDSVQGVENVIGTAFDDAIYGDSNANALTGGTGNDTLTGLGGNDVLDGGLGADTMAGGLGNDTYFVDQVSDVIVENDGEGYDILNVAAAYTLGTGVSIEQVNLTGSGDISFNGNELANIVNGNAGANTLNGRAGDDTLNGAAGTDTLNGGDGNDTLDGGTGADTMAGGLGNDTYYIDNAGDVIVEAAGEGTDTAYVSVDYTIGADVSIENYIITGNGNVTLEGNDQANTLTGGAGDNTIRGNGGDDTLSGMGGNDTLVGGAGNDSLDGGTGADTMTGGTGDDTYYVDNAGDVIVEAAGEGNDTAYVSTDYTLGTGVSLERIVAAGTGDLSLTGNELNNTITGNAGANTISGLAGDDTLSGLDGIDSLLGGTGNDSLDGGTGADTMTGGTGDDTYFVDNANDVIVEAAGEGTDTAYVSTNYNLAPDVSVEQVFVTGGGAVSVTGSDLANTITGNDADNVLSGAGGNDRLNGGLGNDTLDGGSGNDTLVGGAGADTMIGGTGDDSYYIDDAGDVIVEADGEGTDTAYISTNYTMAENTSIERIVLVGNGSLTLTGNAGDNTITGNGANNTIMAGDGNDRLDGGAGADTLQGGMGNDRYVIDNAGDTVVENDGEGIDTIETSISYVLANEVFVENLVLTGTANNSLTGNRFVNALYGNSGNNLIDGRENADYMEGRGGDDIYIVDHLRDVVVEVANQGYDIVRSSVTYSIAGQFIEELDLTGTGDTGGRGNSLDNLIVGNSGMNRLNGDTGADTMIGGLGNDRYVVDNVGDVVVENANEGLDTVESYISYTLGTNLEALKLVGTAAINGTGNAVNNEVSGNNAANVIDGGAGADEMRGFGGNDTYFVDNAGDTVLEALNEGYDIVQSSVSFSINGQYVEELHLTGTANINGTGSGLANSLWGNDGNNTLRGLAGDDKLHGGLGNDTLQGGDGKDSFYFDTALGASNVDKILDFAVVDDTIVLDDAIFTALGSAGALNANAFWTGSAAHDADDRIVYDAATGKIWYDADGSGAGAAVLFAQAGAGLAMTAADFTIV